MQLIACFGGECLSDKKLSIVKGAEAFKFKCANGHIFYKFVTELEQMIMPLLTANRKFSKSMAESSMSSSSNSSFSEEDQHMTSEKQDTPAKAKSCTTPSIWCHKCESYFKGAEVVAKTCGFKLCGDLYGTKLAFKCLKAKHVTPIVFGRRL